MPKPSITTATVNGINAISATESNVLVVLGNNFVVENVAGQQWPRINLWHPMALWEIENVMLDVSFSGPMVLRATFDATYSGLGMAPHAILATAGQLALQVLNRPGDAPNTSLTKSLFVIWPEPPQLIAKAIQQTKGA